MEHVAFLKQYYYLEEQDSTSYGLNPPGQLDVERLLNGQPCWLQPAQQNLHMPKVLILADWTAARWSHQKIEVVNHLLYQFLQRGFSVLVWTDEELIKIDLLNINILNWRKSTTPVSMAKMIDIATKKYRLSLGKFHVFDDYGLDCLLAEANFRSKPCRSLHSSNVLKIVYEQEAVEVLQNVVPPLEKLIQDEFSAQADSHIKQLLKKFPNINRLECRYKKIYIDSVDKLSELFDPHNNFSFDEVYSFKLKGLVLQPAKLMGLLAKIPKIRTLKLLKADEPISGYRLPLSTLNFCELESLVLESVHLPSSELIAICSQATNLRALHVHYPVSGGCIDCLNFNTIESLELDGSFLTANNIEKILALPRLKVLKLKNCSVLADNLMLSNIRPYSLEVLVLERSSISELNLSSILAHTTQFHTLKLKQCQVLYSEQDCSLNISTLRYLELKRCDLSSRKIMGMLAAPALKHLKINQTDTYGLIYDGASQPHLKILNLAHTSIGLNDLKRFLVNAPKLRILDLTNCSNLFFNTDDACDLNLSNIEQLILDGHAFKKGDLEHLFANAAKLKMLSLVRCTGLDHDLGSPCLYHPQLQLMYVGDALLSDKNRQLFLDAAPNLQVRAFPLSRENDPCQFENIPINNSDVVPIDPVFNLSSALLYQPDNLDKFKFKGGNKTKNQAMIIEALSQYLTLKNVDTALIPHMQKGICGALSYWFLTLTIAEFTKNIEMVALWDGKRLPNADSALHDIFKSITQLVKKHQLNIKKQKQIYIGDNLTDFLTQLSSWCVVTNAWHVISIQYAYEHDQWWVYDPNYVNGAKCIAKADLASVIHNSLGPLISVSSSNPNTSTFAEWTKWGYSKRPYLSGAIKDANQFILEGGLLVLRNCNQSDLNAILLLLEKHTVYSVAALQGLLLRDGQGIPAWIVGLHHPKLCRFTLFLLDQFIHFSPANCFQQLHVSMTALTAQQRHHTLAILCQMMGMTTSFTQVIKSDADRKRAMLFDIIRTPYIHIDQYKQALNTWGSGMPHGISIKAYCQHIIANATIKPNQLIELNSQQSVQALQLALQRYCLDTSRPVLYIDKPSDLRCQSAYVFIENDGTGRLKSGLHGPVIDIISQHTSLVMIINYTHFKPAQIVQFNTLLDTVRVVDSVELPKDTFIVGLVNLNHPDCYQGSDFYSRMDSIEICPFTEQELTFLVAPLPFIEDGSTEHVAVINLCHASDWYERLVGRWVIHENKLSFVPGELQHALPTGLPLVIENGLWDKPEFELFWQQAFLHGKIKHSGGELVFPTNGLLIKREGYDWTNLLIGVNLFAGVKLGIDVINPTRLGRCFYQYECDNSKHMLNSLPGFLEHHQGMQLDLNITRTLSEDEWARLLIERQKYGVELNLYLANNVALPESVIIAKPLIHEMANIEAVEHTTLIQSSDPDTTIELIIKDKSDLHVIDVSECNASDLLHQIKASFDDKRVCFNFTGSFNAVLSGLAQHKRICLKGTFSSALSDELAAILIDRHSSSVTLGQLFIVANHLDEFDYLPRKEHVINNDSKINCLINRYFVYEEINTALTETQRIDEPLAMLEARLIYHRINPGHSSDNAWQGYRHLTPIFELAPFDATTSKAVAEAFTHKRLKAVNERLRVSPYLFITGLTAVGKSSFVHAHLSTPDTQVFNGLSKISEWITPTNGIRKILFIDEANLSHRHWSEFEGLFNCPKSILVDGVYHVLDDEHKVIFAGNPLNYGDRSMASLFQRHGNALVFEPMPDAFIYENLIKPLFVDTILEQYSASIASDLFDVYQFFRTCSPNDYLISPREIQMMALLILSYANRHHDVGIYHITQHYRYHLAKGLVPSINRQAFDHIFAPDASLPVSSHSSDKRYLMTPSRELIKHHLDDLLYLNQSRSNITTNSANSDALRYGGLGGIILEGSPGIGKSELVMSTLREHGYTKRTYGAIHQSINVTNNYYYHMPVSMSHEVKGALLRQAFDEGAIVVIDEINGSPLMEQLLNDLLMGHTPEKTRPTTPGFLIIGTQNPHIMGGRRRIGKALAGRLMSMVLPDYSEAEMNAILIALGTSKEKAQSMVCAYIEQLNYAIKHHLKPEPTFRDLLKLADGDRKATVEFQQLVDLESGGALTSALSVLGLFAVASNEMNSRNIINGHSYDV